LAQCLALIERLRPLAEERGMTIAQLALSWVVSRPGITCAIPGAKRPEQVEENAAAGEQLLTEAELERIDRILEEAAVEAPRLMPMRIVKVREGPRGKIGLLEVGVKIKVSDLVETGDVVKMDIVTGQVLP
jgi:hypothetical protein